MGTIPEVEIKEKVLRYEAFINDVLKEQLKAVHSQWEKKNGDMAEWVQLKTTIQSLQDLGLSELKGKLDVGSKIYAQVLVPDTSTIIINLGAGIHMEYTLPESLKVVDWRIKQLEKELDIIRDESCGIKARIKLVLHGIQELQNIK